VCPPIPTHSDRGAAPAQQGGASVGFEPDRVQPGWPPALRPVKTWSFCV
jgi:hypothetical protein